MQQHAHQENRTFYLASTVALNNADNSKTEEKTYAVTYCCASFSHQYLLSMMTAAEGFSVGAK